MNPNSTLNGPRISLAPQKMSLTSDTSDNSSTDQHSAIKSNTLNSIDKIRKHIKSVLI